MTLKVFISYAKEDQLRAVDLSDRLQQAGFSPWLDVKHLLPGQNWQAEIDKAFRDAHVIVLLLSPQSVSKRGFVQREANDAMENLRYKLPTDIYVIPLLLASCEVPTQISTRLQYIDLNVSDAWDHVLDALKLAAEQQSIELSTGYGHGAFQVFTETIAERWIGKPGHDISIDFPVFRSSAYPELSAELSQFFRGRAVKNMVSLRQKHWDQDPDLFLEGSDFPASNDRWEDYGIAFANDNFLSVSYHVGFYHAGAAHPNAFFETYNFSFVPGLQLVTLEEFFGDARAAVKVLSDLCVKALCHEHWVRTGKNADEADIRMFRGGAGQALNDFENYTVKSSGFTFLFAPYQVSSYAMGMWAVDVSFYDLQEVLRVGGPHLLVCTK